MKSAISVPDTTDHSDHGTGMAGLMLYGDLTDITYRHGGPIIIEQDLASVKIVENGHTTDPDFYGAVIEDAIYQAQAMGASIQCMTESQRQVLRHWMKAYTIMASVTA